MCYQGCKYERYPNGPNEGCVCKRGKNPCEDQIHEIWYCEAHARELVLGEETQGENT